MKIDVLGVKINNETKNGIVFLIKKLLGENHQIFIVTPYSEMIVRAQKDQTFKNILNSATFALPDGVGVLWAAKYLQVTTYNFLLKFWYLIITLGAIVFYPKYIRSPIPERISGSDFIWDLARLAGDRGYSIFLLGGFGDTPDHVSANLMDIFPNLKIAGTAAPVIARSETTKQSQNEIAAPLARNGEIINQINSSGADFLFVALGPIEQEKWISENLPNLHVKLAIGLGGTFDYLAGKRVPAPRIWAKMGLEWLWRLITQPWRLLRIGKGVLGLIWYVVRSGK